MSIRVTAALLIVVAATTALPGQTPLGTEFTYQGRLANAGSPANGLHDLRFRLYDASGSGAQVGTILCVDNVSVAEGLFTVPLDFGAQFSGQERFLEIDVRVDAGLGCGNDAGFVTLSPRQKLTAAPYALRAVAVDWGGVVGPPACFPLCLPFSGAISSGVAFGINATSASDVANLTIANATSGAECLDALSNGGGNVVEATMTGTGRAGFFDITNPSNTNEALFSTSNGSGTTISATMSGTGRAGSFNNSFLGADFDVELSGPNGAINTSGFVYREYTGSTRSAAIPVAYGSISAAGATNGGTGNFTVTHTVPGEYDITISGETYSNSAFAVSVTPLHNTIPVSGTAADAGTPLRINIWRLDTGVKADIPFQFIVYTANPSEPG